MRVVFLCLPQSLPREKLAYFRQPWQADFSSQEKQQAGGGAIHNSFERFVAKDTFGQPTSGLPQQARTT